MNWHSLGWPAAKKMSLSSDISKSNLEKGLCKMQGPALHPEPSTQVGGLATYFFLSFCAGIDETVREQRDAILLLQRTFTKILLPSSMSFHFLLFEFSQACLQDVPNLLFRSLAYLIPKVTEAGIDATHFFGAI